ncbi:MAG TPA: M23 family metallopeptidase [Reyranella sp.]|nr:M23 family metallopeptidase [Reyranella sp.]
MSRFPIPVLAMAFVTGPLAMPAFADPGATDAVQVAEVSEGDLPYSRAIGVTGIVKSGLATSLTVAGIPSTAALEAEKAFATEIDTDRDVRDGDRFYVRYEQRFTLEGHAFGDGRVLWAELTTVKRGTFAVHRFRPAGAAHDSLWMLSGQGAGPAPLRLPLASIAVTSGFGMRADPLDQPVGRYLPMGPVSAIGHSPLQYSPLGAGSLAESSLGQNWLGRTSLSSGFGHISTPSIGHGQMFLHAGVDLVASPGTPIEAAGDGVVVGAAPNGRYGNWIQIDHGGGLATVYGHLSGFARGIKPGARVKQGDLIGFTGNTGRTTGPHLHFEILTNGRPGNPIGHPATRHAQLRGADMVRFRKVVAADVAERARETRSM